MQSGKHNTVRRADIKGRRKANAALQQSEEQFRLAMEHSAIGMALVAPDGKWLKVNRALCRIVGRTEEEMLATNFQSITHPDDMDADLEHVRQVLKGEINTYQMEKRYFHKDGRTVWVLLTVSLVRNAAGKPRYFISQIQDITERKRSEQKFRDFMESAPDAIVIVNAEGKIALVNSQTERLFGYKRAELLGQGMEILVPERFRARHLHHRSGFFTNANSRPMGAGLDLFGRRKDGTEFPVEISLSPIETAEGVLVSSSIRDVTERRRIENVLRRDAHIFEHMHDAIVCCDAESRVTVWNDGAERLFGWKREEMIGRHIIDRFPPEIHPMIHQFMEQIYTEEGPQHGEWEDYRKDGSRVWVYWRSRRILDTEGKVAGMASAATDISERKQAHEALLGSQATLSAAQNIAHLGSWEAEIVNSQVSNRQSWSDECYRILGFAPRSVEGTKELYLSRLHPDDRVAVERAVTEAIRKHRDYASHHRIILQNGEIRYLHERAKIFINEQTGQPSRIVGVVHDVTEQKLAEDKLREQAALLNQTSSAVVVRGLNEVVQFWSRGAERTYGWTAAEVIGRNSVEFLYKDRARFYEARRLLMEKGNWAGELNQITKGGQEIIVECRWTVLSDENGIAKSILAINTDVTEKKRLESQFLRSQRMESIGTLASGIAHDLNNVLAPIVMSIALLRERTADNESLGILESLERNARRGADIVKQVLSFGRGVAGERAPVNPKHLFCETERIVRETFPKSIELEMDDEPDLWMVTGDSTQLQQVLLNLCVNARDAMPDGGRLRLIASNVRLDESHAVTHPECKPGNYLLLEVSDTGIGITPENKDKIFEPFFTTKEFGTGTGLGLSTSLAIVKSHGGFVTVSSTLGKGSTFRIYLPGGEMVSIADAKSGSPDFPRGSGETVLVVDDEDSILQVARRILERSNYNVLTAPNGAVALELYAKHRERVAAVLTDMMMPVMDGATMVRNLLKINPDLVIIGTSGLGSSGGAGNANASGIKHFLPKPYSTEDLLKTLQSVLAPARR